MSFWKAPFNLIWLAVLLPSTIVITLVVASLVADQRAQVVEATGANAAEITRTIDTLFLADLATLTALAASTALPANDLGRFETFMGNVRAQQPLWAGLAYCSDAGAAILAVGAPEVVSDICRAGDTAGGVGDVERVAGQAMARVVHRLQGAGLQGRTLVILRSTADIDALLQERTGGAVVAGVVDRQGRFAARTLDSAQRAGTQGSSSLRRAVSSGGAGVYAGTTLEGVSNFTAYATSTATGWSTHIAIPTGLLDAPQSHAIGVVLAGGLASLLIGAALIVVVSRDVGERTRAAAAAQEAEKLRALGQLAAGIAHDFNNVLTGVIGSLDLLGRQIAGDAPARRHHDAALHAARRGAAIARQLLVFAREEAIQTQPVDLAALLRRSDGLLTASVNRSVVIKVHVDPDLRWIEADEAQVEVALLNLAINADHAMADGGTLTITAQPAAGRGSDVEYVEVSVEDTGDGMDTATLERALEPFFTTKPLGVGTGLGLSHVHAMMRAFGGDLALESVKGQGTKVRLLFKAASPPA